MLADGGKALHPDSFIFDTLSITTEGLDEAVAHLDLARDKGYVADVGLLPYVVADAPDRGKSLLVKSILMMPLDLPSLLTCFQP